VWDAGGGFRQKVNTEMVAIEELDDSDLDYVKGRIERHVAHTGRTRGQAILAAWPSEQKRFVKVMPTDYKRALDELRKLAAQDQQAAKQAEVKVNG
jgi:glutamate synthase (NADPH/NADH) large chain